MGNKTAKYEIYDDIRNGLANDSFLYRIIGLKGDGQLVELMKQSQSINDFTMLDEYLKKDLISFLYNRGEGQNVKLLLFKKKYFH